MSEPKFTPGPWSVRDKICIFRFLSVTSDKSPFMIAKVMEPDMQRILEDATKEKANWEQLSANAALIAAAPDMYEFIKSLTSFGGQIALATLGEDGMKIYNEAMRVLAKARGEVQR